MGFGDNSVNIGANGIKLVASVSNNMRKSCMKYGVCWCRCSEINFYWGVPLIGGLFLLLFLI